MSYKRGCESYENTLCMEIGYAFVKSGLNNYFYSKTNNNHNMNNWTLHFNKTCVFQKLEISLNSLGFFEL